jgi:hypothetical protein
MVNLLCIAIGLVIGLIYPEIVIDYKEAKAKAKAEEEKIKQIL